MFSEKAPDPGSKKTVCFESPGRPVFFECPLLEKLKSPVAGPDCMLLKGNGICGGRSSGKTVRISSEVERFPPIATACVPVLCGRCDADFAKRVLSTFSGGRESQRGFIICSPDEEAKDVFASSDTAAVSDFDPALFLDGDLVEINGYEGVVKIENVIEKPVVNCVVMKGDMILILKRSDRVGSFQGKWSTVTGYVEEGETPVQAAFKEMREEISVSTPTLLRQGKAVSARKADTAWISYPFLFSVEEDTEVKIDWEHTDYKWLSLHELTGFETTPGLWRNLSSLGLVAEEPAK